MTKSKMMGEKGFFLALLVPTEDTSNEACAVTEDGFTLQAEVVAVMEPSGEAREVSISANVSIPRVALRIRVTISGGEEQCERIELRFPLREIFGAIPLMETRVREKLVGMRAAREAILVYRQTPVQVEIASTHRADEPQES